MTSAKGMRVRWVRPSVGAGALVALLAVACGDGTEDDGDGGSVVNRLATSPGHACALRRAGLHCWGDNLQGALGTGDVESRDRPVAATVAGADIVELAAASGRTCVRRRGGEVACWGANDRGQLGDGTREPAVTPVTAPGIHDARQLAIDDGSTCVLHASGSVSCWGQSPDDSPEQGTLLPWLVPGLEDVVELRAGTLGTYCVRERLGSVRCLRLVEGHWDTLVEVPELAGASAIGVTFMDEVCGITSTSTVLCTNLDTHETYALNDSSDATELRATGSLSACARKADGTWHCWNVLPSMLASLGSPAIAVESDVPIVELSLSGFNGCALREDDSVACADANDAAGPALRVVDGLPP
jgi:hypothetical protein